jgi:hypothetical protein
VPERRNPTVRDAYARPNQPTEAGMRRDVNLGEPEAPADERGMVRRLVYAETLPLS